MQFSLAQIVIGENCTTQLLLDGRDIFVAALRRVRTDATLDIFKCQSPCCSAASGRGSAHRDYSRAPLTLKLAGTECNDSCGQAHACMSIRLVRRNVVLENSTIKINMPMLPLDQPASRPNVVLCKITVLPSNSGIQVELLANGGESTTTLLRATDDVSATLETTGTRNAAIELIAERSREQTLQELALSERDSIVSIGMRTDVVWVASACVGASGNTGQELVFDDRLPRRLGLTGQFAWEGLQQAGHVRIRELVFWSNRSEVTGVQATYEVDGERAVGPRHRMEQGERHLRAERVTFYEHEGIRNMTAIHPQRAGSCAMVMIRIGTTAGRTVRVGPGRETARASETIQIPDDSPVVSLFGALGTGIQSLGLIYEQATTTTQPSTAERRSPQCPICSQPAASWAPAMLSTHVQACVRARATALEASATARTYAQARARIAALPLSRVRDELCARDADPTTVRDTGAAHDARACRICFTRPFAAAFLWCGHVAACAVCAEEMYHERGRCPICNADIVRIQPVFLP